MKKSAKNNNEKKKRIFLVTTYNFCGHILKIFVPWKFWKTNRVFKKYCLGFLYLLKDEVFSRKTRQIIFLANFFEFGGFGLVNSAKSTNQNSPKFKKDYQKKKQKYNLTSFLKNASLLVLKISLLLIMLYIPIEPKFGVLVNFPQILTKKNNKIRTSFFCGPP